MDPRNFDELTRKLATGTSRRNVLRGLIGGGAALIGMKAADISAAPRTKVTLCHATSSLSNPWVMITVDPNSVDYPAHLSHGDVFAGAGTQIQCCRDQDCPASLNPCQVPVCNRTVEGDVLVSSICGFGPAPAGTVCRAATDLCDVAEVCDGVSQNCPDDGVAAAGTECRAATDLCDVAEVCDGINKTCPPDGVAAAGTECRAATGPCDVAEVCDGINKTCPPDGFLPAGTSCSDCLLCAADGTCTVDDPTCDHCHVDEGELLPNGCECELSSQCSSVCCNLSSGLGNPGVCANANAQNCQGR